MDVAKFRLILFSVSGSADYILYNNRICPFQTFARQFTAKLYGKPSYKGLTAEQVAAGWVFFYDDWKNEPMIKVKNGHVRHLLNIDGKYASLEDFYRTVSSGTMQQAIDSLQAIDDQATIRALGEADERYQIANMVANGTMLKLFPLNHGGHLEWYSHGSLDIPHDIDDGKWLFMRNGMDYLYEMIASQDWNGAHQLKNPSRPREHEGYNLTLFDSLIPASRQQVVDQGGDVADGYLAVQVAVGSRR